MNSPPLIQHGGHVLSLSAQGKLLSTARKKISVECIETLSIAPEHSCCGHWVPSQPISSRAAPGLVNLVPHVTVNTDHKVATASLINHPSHSSNDKGKSPSGGKAALEVPGLPPHSPQLFTHSDLNQSQWGWWGQHAGPDFSGADAKQRRVSPRTGQLCVHPSTCRWGCAGGIGKWWRGTALA